MKPITKMILQLRDEYIQSGTAKTYRAINGGYCVNFAEDLVWLHREIGSAEEISNDIFIQEREDEDAWNGDGLDIFNVDALLQYGSPPPDDLTGEELGKKILGYHAWVYYEGKHYDAECPEGVSNLFDLPFFKRHLTESEIDHLLNSISFD